MFVCSSKTRIILIGIRGWYLSGWKEAKYCSSVEENYGKKRWSWRTNFILDHENLGCTQRECKPNEIIEEEHTKNVWITYFCWSNWKVTRVWKASHKNSRMVLRHGTTCSKMRWAILWLGKQECGAVIQSFNSLLGWPPIQERRTCISRESYHKFAHKLLWNACTWHELEDQTITGLSTNLQEQSQNGLRHVTDDWQDWYYTFTTQVTIDNVVMWRNTAEHCRLGLFQDPDFAGDLADSKSTSVRILCIFGSRTFVPFLDVQETNVSIPHFYRIWNHFVGCWTANGWITWSWFMACGDRSVTFIEQYQTT